MDLCIGSKIFTVLPFIHRAMCAQWITRLCMVSFLHGHLTPWIVCMSFWCSYQLESGFQCDISLPCALSLDYLGFRHLPTWSLGCLYLSWSFPRISCLFAFRWTVLACSVTNLLKDFNPCSHHREQSLIWIQIMMDCLMWKCPRCTMMIHLTTFETKVNRTKDILACPWMSFSGKKMRRWQIFWASLLLWPLGLKLRSRLIPLHASCRFQQMKTLISCCATKSRGQLRWQLCPLILKNLCLITSQRSLDGAPLASTAENHICSRLVQMLVTFAWCAHSGGSSLTGRDSVGRLHQWLRICGQRFRNIWKINMQSFELPCCAMATFVEVERFVLSAHWKSFLARRLQSLRWWRVTYLKHHKYIHIYTELYLLKYTMYIDCVWIIIKYIYIYVYREREHIWM